MNNTKPLFIVRKHDKSLFSSMEKLFRLLKPLGSFENAWTENIKLNKVGEFIEGEKQNFPESRDGINFKRYYHATSRGLLINELVRRIHPQVLTIIIYTID